MRIILINVGVWVQQYFIHIITRRNCSEKNSIVAVIFTLIVSMFLSSRNIVYAAEDKARAITIHMQGLSDEAYYVDLLKITKLKHIKNTAEKSISRVLLCQFLYFTANRRK